jgi:hypothetical protein
MPNASPFANQAFPNAPQQTGSSPNPIDPNAWGAGGASANRNAAGGGAFGGYANMANNPGIPANIQNLMTQQALNSANSSYAGANDSIARMSAASGNRAYAPAAMSTLAGQKAGTQSDIVRQNQIAFQQERQRQYETGLSGLSNMYGGESNFLANLLGQQGRIDLSPIASLVQSIGTGQAYGASGTLAI